jgi:hypothetical protein
LPHVSDISSARRIAARQLRLEDSWQWESGRTSKTLAKYPDLRIVIILMKSGTRIRQHRAEGMISIQAMNWAYSIRFHATDGAVPVGFPLIREHREDYVID